MQMKKDECENVVYQECMSPIGFATALREGRIDNDGYSRLLASIRTMTGHIEHDRQINRLCIACLFELPWEIENCVDHFRNQDENSGIIVSRMAENLREAINELLWIGLEEHYKSN